MSSIKDIYTPKGARWLKLDSYAGGKFAVTSYCSGFLYGEIHEINR